jgi:ribosome maturation factor RimP
MIDEQTETLIEACIQRTMELEDELELVESIVTPRSGNPLIRLVIYRPAGVTVEDCARVNRRLSRELEASEDLQRTFAIEVSSPGLDRKLRSRGDFQRAVGEVLRLRVEQGGREKTVTGLLTEVGQESLLLDPVPRKGKRKNEDERTTRVPLDEVVEGRIEVLL